MLDNFFHEEDQHHIDVYKLKWKQLIVFSFVLIKKCIFNKNVWFCFGEKLYFNLVLVKYLFVMVNVFEAN